MPPFDRLTSRRRFLAGSAALGAAAALAPLSARGLGQNGSVQIAPLARPNALTGNPRHLAWVWQWQHDGDRSMIRDVLGSFGLGVVVKTHDGTSWMSRYDKSEHAIAGPESVLENAAFFENAGVPFHAWSVVDGREPQKEAEMASSVLSAGARSLFIDLEPHRGFWRGTAETALEFGETLRRSQPNSHLSTSIDPRPWEVERIPLTEFASFTNEISPQAYWPDFSSPANIAKYKLFGAEPGEAGVTPTFVLDTSMQALGRFGLPIHPIGAGTVAATDGWGEFVEQSYAHNASSVSVWRFGVAEPGIWQLLYENPPPVAVAASYVVQAGDSLSAIAAAHGTTMQTLIELNGIADPNRIVVGQELVLPGGAAPAPPATTGGSVAPAAAGETYVVQNGDTLWGIARRWGTSVEAVAQANGLDLNGYILVGQELRAP